MAKRKKKITAPQNWSYKYDFPTDEVCGTYHVLARQIVPRLQTFKVLDKHGYAPGCKDIEDWNRVIQKMIDAFELLEYSYSWTEEENKTINEGPFLFCKYFRNLWD